MTSIISPNQPIYFQLSELNRRRRFMMTNKRLQKSSQNPLYQQLMTRLRNDIDVGIYASGEKIPSEQQMCERYGVSRVTVRKAMLDLVQEGLLVRRQGKGTYVAEEKIKRDLLSITSFSNVCDKMGFTAHSKLISFNVEIPSADERKKLELEDDENVIEICRVRITGGEPVLLEINRYPQRYQSILEDRELVSQYETLEKNGIIPSFAEHDVSLGRATPFVSKYLPMVAEGEALLLLDEMVYDQHRHPLHTSRQWIRGERFVFRI